MFGSFNIQMTQGQKEIGRIFFSLVIFTAMAMVFMLGHLTRRYTHVIKYENKYFVTYPREMFINSNFTDPEGRVTSLLRKEEFYVVPNIVHYVWFGKNEMFGFQHYLGVKSALLNISPTMVLFHCDYEPIGEWWKKLKQLVSEHGQGSQSPWVLNIVHRRPPQTVLEREVTKPRHKVDIAAIEILMDQGGIYLDLDIIALMSFNPLRMYNMTMGLEYFGNPGRLNNGIILARKDTPFLKIWYQSYKDFVKSEWDEHSAQIPYKLQFQYPELIHVEKTSLNFPGGKDMELIYEKKYDWRNNYAIHLWEELHGLEHNPVSITRMNNTFGEIASKIYYEQDSVR